MMNFDSSEDYFSCSDSSVYGWDNKEALNAVDSTLLELSRRKKASMPNHMRSFLRERKSHAHIDLMDDSTCHDVTSLRDRMRQVRFQLAIQKQLIDKGRDRSSEKAAVCLLKDKQFLTSHTLSASVDQARPPRLQISVPQHFSEKQSRRQKAEGVTAWDGSQYMLSLLFSLGDRLLAKFCFLFLRDRAQLWTKKKEVAEMMFEQKCRMLITESFAGLKVSWLQVRLDSIGSDNCYHVLSLLRVHEQESNVISVIISTAPS
jgi:hypothetical protein